MAVSAEGLQGKGSSKRSVFPRTSVAGARVEKTRRSRCRGGAAGSPRPAEHAADRAKSCFAARLDVNVGTPGPLNPEP